MLRFRRNLFFERFRITDNVSELMTVELFDLLDIFVTFIKEKLVFRIEGFFIGFRELQKGLDLTIIKRVFFFRHKLFKIFRQGVFSFGLNDFTIRSRIISETIVIIDLDSFNIRIELVKILSADFEKVEQFFALNKKYVSVIEIKVFEILAFFLGKYHDLLLFYHVFYQLVVGCLR
jgi:hypothetical protein